MKVLAGQDETVAAWAGEQLGVRFVLPLAAFGIVDEMGSLKGAAIFNDYYRGGNVEWTHVGRGSLSRSILRTFARYCFDHLGASRVTAKTAFRNVQVRRLLPKAGFAFEGTQKRYYGPERGDDALVFVLFRDKAERWLGH